MAKAHATIPMPENNAAKKKPSARDKKRAKQFHQFKITPLGIKPGECRRIQVEDGSLDDLHWQIQGAFGWTNSNLHDFDVGPDRSP